MLAFWPFEAKVKEGAMCQYWQSSAAAAKCYVGCQKGGPMIKACINYQTSRVTIHRNPNCTHAKVGPGEIHRHIVLNADTISGELRKFEKKKHRFASEAGLNDMWLIVDFFDTEFEEAIVAYIRKRIGNHYKPIKDSELYVHC